MTTPISTRARLLVEAGERAHSAGRFTADFADFQIAAVVDAPDIAAALVEATDILRALLHELDYDDIGGMVEGQMERARAWLAKWEGDASDSGRAALPVLFVTE